MSRRRGGGGPDFSGLAKALLSLGAENEMQLNPQYKIGGAAPKYLGSQNWASKLLGEQNKADYFNQQLALMTDHALLQDMLAQQGAGDKLKAEAGAKREGYVADVFPRLAGDANEAASSSFSWSPTSGVTPEFSVSREARPPLRSATPDKIRQQALDMYAAPSLAGAAENENKLLSAEAERPWIQSLVDSGAESKINFSRAVGDESQLKSQKAKSEGTYFRNNPLADVARILEGNSIGPRVVGSGSSSFLQNPAEGYPMYPIMPGAEAANTIDANGPVRIPATPPRILTGAGRTLAPPGTVRDPNAAAAQPPAAPGAAASGVKDGVKNGVATSSIDGPPVPTDPAKPARASVGMNPIRDLLGEEAWLKFLELFNYKGNLAPNQFSRY